MNKKATHFCYIVIEDSLKICEGIKARMNSFSEWKCCGFSHHIEDAKLMVEKKKPQLIFLDWALQGGSANDVLQHIATLTPYNPYIIFNTGYQIENPEIPQEIINNYKVDKYLMKPFWDKLRTDLATFVQEAELKNLSSNINNYAIWVTNSNKTKQQILVEDIVCICINDENSYFKEIIVNKQEKVIIKNSWSEIFTLLEPYKNAYFIANSKEHLVFKKHIISYKRPYAYLLHSKKKIRLEIVKNKLALFEDWLNEGRM